MSMERLTEKRQGQWVIPLRQDGSHRWSLCSAGMGAASTEEYEAALRREQDG